MANKQTMTPTSVKNLSLPKYGFDSLSWDRARERLEEEWKDQGPGGDNCPHTHFIATVKPDGSPHVAPAGIAYHNGKFYLVSGAGTRKSKNLAANPKCTIAVAAKGLDLTVEGEAQIVRDEAKLNELAEVYSGWGPKVENGAFVHDYSAPSAGPPPWDLYEITPKTVFGVATAEPHGATRWDL
jgi:nitroimidazol reductase NimA-like FMN-containing flavoprotein (pyridoxamine 5'-phosphate oxidase superfamily)